LATETVIRVKGDNGQTWGVAYLAAREGEEDVCEENEGRCEKRPPT